MKPKQILVVVPAALFILGSGAANAGETINEAGAIALRDRQVGRVGT